MSLKCLFLLSDPSYPYPIMLGHAGGEVERVLSMVDGVILVVDATEGPMAQTKFVLSKAIEQNLKPVVVINKVSQSVSQSIVMRRHCFPLFNISIPNWLL